MSDALIKPTGSTTEGAKPEEKPVVVPAAATPVIPPAAAAPAIPVAPTPGAAPVEKVPTRKLIGDDDDIPDDADLIEMSPKKLKGRLDRYTKKQLKDRFGTDDFDNIKGRLDKLADFEAKAEEARLAALNETDRLKEQLATSEKLRLAAEQGVETAKTQRVIDHEDRKISGVLSKYVDEDDHEYVSVKLARAIDRASAADLENPTAFVDNFVKDFVAKRPKFAKASEKVEEKKEPKKEIPKVPFTNGAPGGKPTNVQQFEGKTAAPGKANSMSAAELREYKKTHNIQY